MGGRKLRLTAELITDIFHRLNRNQGDACRQSGLWTTYVTEVCVVNGLVQTKQCHLYTEFLDCALGLQKTLQADHALLLKFWRSHL